MAAIVMKAPARYAEGVSGRIWAYADTNDSDETIEKHANNSVAENMPGELFDRKQ